MTRRAIVVEDQPNVLTMLGRMLVDVLGYEVAPEDLCMTLEEAHDAVCRGPIPALVVCDVFIPSTSGLNGANLAAAVKQPTNPRGEPNPLAGVPFVVISGAVPEDAPDVQRAKRFGAAYLEKPFLVRELQAAIERAKSIEPTHSMTLSTLAASVSMDTLL
jgi:CheY-like chemotaxis protein